MDQHRRFLLATLFVAAGLRTAYACLVWSSWFQPPDTGTPWRAVVASYAIAGEVGYVQGLKGTPAQRDLGNLARSGEAGEWVGPTEGTKVSSEGMRPEMLYPPGLSLVGAGLHRATSLPASTSMQCVGVVVDTVGVWFLFQIILACGFSATLARRSAVAYAVFPPLVYNAVRMYAMNVMPALMLAVTWLAIGAAAETGRRRWTRLLAAGALLGVSGYFRSDYLLYGVFLGGSLAFCGYSWRMAAGAVGIMTATAFATLLPWAARNLDVGGEFIFTSGAPGAVMVTGLGAHPNPWGFLGTDADRYRQAREAGIEDPFGVEGNRYFHKVFREAIMERPDAYLGIVARRTVESVAAGHDWGLKPPEGLPRGSELRQSGDFSRVGDILAAHWPKAISALASLVGCVGCAVMWWNERRRAPLVAVALMLPLYAIACHLPTHVMPAYLLPALPIQLWGLLYLCGRHWRDMQTISPST